MEIFLHSLWVSIRSLRATKMFTVLSLITLSLAMAGNALIFSAIYVTLLNPLSFSDPDRLVMIWETNHGAGREHDPVAPTNFFGWQTGGKPFKSMAAMSMRRYNLTGGEAVQVTGEAVSASFFPLLGVQPAMGRFFLAEEDQPGKNTSAILSNSFWQQRFGSDRNVLGKTLTLDGTNYVVVGVMGPDFEFLSDKPVLWVPLGLNKNAIWKEGRYLRVVARMASGYSVNQAQTELTGISKGLESLNPEQTRDWKPSVVPLYEEYVGNIRPVILLLMAACVFVLLICCANISSLTVGRAIARQSEVGIRLALGSSRKRLIMEMMNETFVLTVCSAAIALLLTFGGIKWLSATLADVLSGPRLEHMQMGVTIFLFTGLVALVVTLLIGLIPAILFSRSDIAAMVNQHSRGSSAGTRTLLNGLVVCEVAVSAVLFIGAGLMAASLHKLQSIDLGIRPSQVLTAQISLPGTKYDTDPRIARFVQDSLQRIRTIPGVHSAGAIDWLPLSGAGAGTYFAVQNRPEFTTGKKPIAFVRSVTPGYFEGIGTPLLQGRFFTDADDATRPRVYLISENLAKRYFPGQSPIGQKLEITWDHPLIGEIVGVVGDVRFTELKSEPEMTVYWPTNQLASGTFNLVVRSEIPPESLVHTLAQEIGHVDPAIPLTHVQTVEKLRDAATARTRAIATLLTAYSVMALVLAAVGIFGLLGYIVTRRTREIGIRVALGALPGSIMIMVLRQALVPFGAGLIIGLAGAVGLTRLMVQSLYGVKPEDPAVYATVALVFTVVALLASVMPVRMAAGIEPNRALRQE